MRTRTLTREEKGCHLCRTPFAALSYQLYCSRRCTRTAAYQRWIGRRPAPSRQQLTSKQQRVLVRLARGDTERQIADEMGISHDAVSDSVVRARRTLGAKNIPQAVALALVRGVIRAEEVVGG